MKTFIILCVLLLQVLSNIGVAHAEKAAMGFYFGQSIGASLNPLGLLLDSKLFYRLPLVNKDGILWESTKYEAGLQNEWTPADDILSARFAVEPIALCDVVVKAGAYGMSNLLGYGCFRFASADIPYGPDAQKHMKPGGARGYWLSVAPTLKAKLSRLIVLNTATINAVAINGSGVFLEVRSYLPHRTNDIDIIDDAYCLVEFTKSVMAGPTYHYAYVRGTSLRSQRLSAMAIVTPKAKPLSGTFAAVNAGYYFDDPLFGRKGFVGGMVGGEFRLARRPSVKEGK